MAQTNASSDATLAWADGIAINSHLLDGLQRHQGGHAVRLLVFLTLYLSTAWGAWVVATRPGEAWQGHVLAVPFYLIAAAALHGISLFTHEGVHGTLSRSLNVNRWLAIACALPVLQNYSAYKVLHLNHHRHLGREGDPDHYPNYTRWSWLVFLMHWLRLLVGYPVYIVAIPILGFRQGTRSDRSWIVVEVMLLAAMIAGALLLPIPGMLLIHGWFVPMLFINTMVNIRGMSQHTLLEHASDSVAGTRSILTNRFTAFFMCNENYHLEHHLFPRVPWFNLPQIHRELRDQLVARGAPFIPSYLAFVRDFAVGTWARGPWGTWPATLKERDTSRGDLGNRGSAPDTARPAGDANESLPETRPKSAAFETMLLAFVWSLSVLLAIRRGVDTSLAFEALGVSIAWSVVLSQRQRMSSSWGYRLRWLAAYVLIAWLYLSTGRFVTAMNLAPWDVPLSELDHRLFGDLIQRLGRHASESFVFTELMSASYLCYIVYLHVAILHGLLVPVRYGRRLFHFLGISYAVGLATYLVFPAIGPWRACPEQFPEGLPNGPITTWTMAIVERGSSVYDAFPSLHVLITFTLLACDWRYCRMRFWLAVIPSLGIVLSTVYLRFHYGVDLLAGAVCFAGCWGVSRILESRSGMESR